MDVEIVKENYDASGVTMVLSVRMRPEMKCTSRLSRSSFATTTDAFRFRAALMAAESCGRRSSASAPLPVSAAHSRGLQNVVMSN